MKLFGNTSSDDIQKLTDKSKNKNITVADWDSMDRARIQTRGRAFQALCRALDFLLRLQKFIRALKKHLTECFVEDSLLKSGLKKRHIFIGV